MSEGPFAALPAAIAEIFTQRGFTELTPIQARVLEPELRGRDLRIASQTGSGKTAAIGLVLLPELEAAETTQPLALLIAPTRELAAQLQRELTWMLEPLKMRVAVVAGGANYGVELRALKQKPQLIVGTPGRLLDHLEKGSIDPSSVRAVVLDEADQMLDLGFRDELQAILEHAPKERRTHLVSATFSRDVLSLAEEYQNDALLVEGTSLGDANLDINHVVHLVHREDRLAAVINVLLAAPGERSLLFVRTRADASDLADRLTEAGFHALPLSGELEQRERNKTLDAFRNGVTDILVATDVAARGLDVPDVARVIHVDPPSDDEGLTHRSGRTGRAGRKGTSIMLVTPAAVERVRGMFRRARIEATLEPVPSPKDVIDALDDRLCGELAERIYDPEGCGERYERLAEQLLASHEAKALVAALLARSSHDGPCEPQEVRAVDEQASAPRARSRSRGSQNYSRYRINWGEQDGADPRRLLAMICRRGNIRGDQVGAIRIGGDESRFEVCSTATKFFHAIRRPDPREPHLIIEPLDHARRRGPHSAS